MAPSRIVVSRAVVWGPSSQRSPTLVAPSSTVPGPMTVSRPMVTPASTLVVPGWRKVTPARACSSAMRRWAASSAFMRPARSLTPIAASESSVMWAATVPPPARITGKTPVR